jgi:hypothetical protein
MTTTAPSVWNDQKNFLNYFLTFIHLGNAASLWFSPGTPVYSTNNTDHHDTTEILLKVALNNITLTLIPD